MRAFGIWGPKKSIPPTTGKGGVKKSIPPGKGKGGGGKGGGKKSIGLNFDKGSKGRGGGGDHWGPGGKYNPDNTGCGKKVAEMAALMLAIVAMIVWQVAS